VRGPGPRPAIARLPPVGPGVTTPPPIQTDWLFSSFPAHLGTPRWVSWQLPQFQRAFAALSEMTLWNSSAACAGVSRCSLSHQDPKGMPKRQAASKEQGKVSCKACQAAAQQRLTGGAVTVLGIGRLMRTMLTLCRPRTAWSVWGMSLASERNSCMGRSLVQSIICAIP
jgi:hypothetical protein